MLKLVGATDLPTLTSPCHVALAILPRASERCMHAAPDFKRRLQQLFFHDGTAHGGNQFERTAVTAPLFKYLAASRDAEESGEPNVR